MTLLIIICHARLFIKRELKAQTPTMCSKNWLLRFKLDIHALGYNTSWLSTVVDKLTMLSYGTHILELMPRLLFRLLAAPSTTITGLIIDGNPRLRAARSAWSSILSTASQASSALVTLRIDLPTRAFFYQFIVTKSSACLGVCNKPERTNISSRLVTVSSTTLI